MPLSVGDKLGRYEIIGPLGAGGMGEVYRARDTRLNRDVALKILLAEVVGDLARRQRFEQEARAVAALNHPNIVAIYDIGEENGVYFIVTELIAGESLRRRLDRGPTALDQLTAIAIQLARAITAAHSAGIVHRDLKPENIMLTRDGRPKVLDFGLAKQIKPPAGQVESAETQLMTEPGVIMGTVGYMSPEQVRGEATDFRSDIFSLGGVLYEMASGKRAFSGASRIELMNAILKDEPPPLPRQIGRNLDSIIRRCLQKELERRFQSASDLGFALGRSTDTLGQKRVTVPGWGARAAWAAVVMLLAATIGGLAYRAATRRTVSPKPLANVEDQMKSQSGPIPVPPPAVATSSTANTKKPVEIAKTAVAKRTEVAPATHSLQSAAPVPGPATTESLLPADAARMQTVAQDLARALADERYSDATKDFTERMMSAWAGTVGRDWKQTRLRVREARWLSPSHRQGTDLEYVWGEFQSGIVDLRIIFDKVGRVDHLFWFWRTFDDKELSPEGTQSANAASAERAREAFVNGEKLFGQRKYDDAIKSYDEAIQANGEYAEAFRGRCASQVRALRYDRALLDCTRAIRIKPDDIAAYRWRGDALSGFKAWDFAIPLYDEAIRLKNTDDAFYNQRAWAYQNIGQYDSCIRDATKGLQLNPKSLSLWSNRAFCYEHARKYDLAIEDATQSISLAKDSASYNRRGSYYIEAKQYKKSLDDFNEAIRLKPDYKDAYNNRGFAKDMLGDAAGAAADRDYARRLP